jgi:hypothetical protein
MAIHHLCIKGRLNNDQASRKDGFMKKNILISALIFTAGVLAAAESEDVKAAAKKLGEQKSYSWKTTVVVPEGSQFRPGPTEGKTEKDGYTSLSMSFGDNTTEAVIKGDKGAAKMEGEWRSLADMAQDSGQPGAFMARRLQNYRTPAMEAEEIAGKTKELKKDGDAYSADLTEEGAKDLLRFRGSRRGGGGGGGGADPKNAKGSAKFWVKDGQLAKYEYKVSGTINFGGEDRDVERTTTVEIKDVGTTKIEVPEDAKKKMAGT